MEATLERMSRLAQIMAAERTRDPNLYEELVQEGMIAAWRSLSSHPDKTLAYHAASMRNGVNDLLRGRAPFGAPSRQGRRQVDEAPLTAVGEDGEEYFVKEPSLPPGDDEALARLIVRDLLSILSPEQRAIVRAHYWEGWTDAEIGARLGVSPATAHRWRQQAILAMRNAAPS